jgi:tetratricopeptide (TPR) repeat protein
MLVGLARAADDEVGQVWQLVADHLGRDAFTQINRIKGPSTRERKFAEAVIAIDHQPVTQDRLREAEATLADLARGDDEIAPAAAYLQARMHQIHFQQQDYARAAALYRALAERHPHSHWAQLGLVKYGLLLLYALPEPTTSPGRIAAAAALLPRLEEKELVRDLHLQLGRAGTFYEQPLETVLPHLVAADTIGGLIGQAKEDLIVMIGELSLRAGNYPQSRAYFERYLRDYTYNLRLVTVRRRLEELTALEAAVKGGMQ